MRAGVARRARRSTRAGARDLADGVLGERDRRAVPRDGDDVLDGRRADADGDGLLCVHGGHSTGAARRCHRTRSDSCLASETVRAMANVPAAGHALDVLTLLGRHVAPVPASAIARDLGLPRSTTYHLLGVLVDKGFVVHLPEERRYGLGTAAFELGSAYARQEPLRWIAATVLSRLVADTTHNGHFAVLDGRDTLYLIEERARRAAEPRHRGRRAPARAADGERPGDARGAARAAGPRALALTQRPRPPPRRGPRLADRAARAARRRARAPATPSRTATSRPGSPRSRRRSWTTTPTRSPPWRSPSRRTRSTPRRGPRSPAGSSPRPGPSRATSAAARPRRPSPRADPRRQGASRSSAQPSPVRR